MRADGNVSIVIAVYNGGEYIEEQLSSIVCQLDENDELIVIDDCSTDNSLDILRNVNFKNTYIYTNNKNLGVNKSFERGILMTKNDFIFLADQDDVWTDNRLDIMLNSMRKDVLVVFGNSLAINQYGITTNYELNYVHNYNSLGKFNRLFGILLGKSPYYGCAMGFKREMIDLITPFPSFIESHDLWIALNGVISNSIFHLDEIVLNRRIHGNNASIINRPLVLIIASRLLMLMEMLIASIRMVRRRVRS